MSNAERIESAARRVLGLIDDSSFRDGAFTPGTICTTLRSSGEVIGLRDALRPSVKRDAWHDDSGDDEMHDGGIGIPGIGFAREHEALL